MKKQLIITHPGSAHFDDMTAVSLVLAFYSGEEFSIERREPTDQELVDNEIWTIDVGDRYEPEKRNFDHHQSLDCPASFVLIADHLGFLPMLTLLPWWKFKDSQDRFGPVKAARDFNAGDDLVNHNPLEDWILDYFAADPEGSIPLLKSYGQYVIDSAQQLKTQIDFWQNARRLNIAGIPAVIGETRESLGLEEFRRLTPDPPDIVISMDRRSDGWRLFRYEGTRVDFSLIADCPEIEFAHKSGFLAKTRERLPVDELISLVSKAVVKEK